MQRPPPTDDALSTRRGTVRLDVDFEWGGPLSVEVAYETYGDSEDPTVLVAHALTGSAHVATNPPAEAVPYDRPCDPLGGQGAGWWADVVGPGRAVDTDAYHVVSVTVPGSPYGPACPAATDPATGEPYGAAFPPVTVADWTRAQRGVLAALGVGRLRAVVGGSVGGMNALDWAKRHPDRVERVVPVAAGPRLDPQVLALDAVARRAITADPDWRGGDYHPDHPDRGLALARQLGLVAYRSKASMARQFGRDPSATTGPAGPERFPPGPASPYRAVESYLAYNAGRFVERFDANCYLRLLAAMDGYDLAAGHGSAAAALSGFDGEALVVSYAGDWHFTAGQSVALVDAFRAAGGDAVHHAVDSDYGHDAFLVEPGSLSPLRPFLDRGVAGLSDAHAPVHAGLLG